MAKRAPPLDSRGWTPADRQAGVIPILALRHCGRQAIDVVVGGRSLTVLAYGRPVAHLVPIPGAKLRE